MHCPSFVDLPPPSSDKIGWPWNEDSIDISISTLSWESCPRISIITPSYNQAQFLEETIRSVLLQGYPDLEYIVMDGGSSDNSAEVIQKYEPWLAYWESEQDRGQCHAINKGWNRITGEITGWLNSDDIYRPGALRYVMEAFRHNPDAVVVVGACALTDIELNTLSIKGPKSLSPKNYFPED